MWSTLTPIHVDGTIPQVECAKVCVGHSDPSVAVKTNEFCVLAAVKNVHPLAESGTTRKIVALGTHMGMTYAGLDADFRVVSKSMYKFSLRQFFNNVTISSNKISHAFQEYTHACATRPFGLAILLTGYSLLNRLALYKIDACGNKISCNVGAVGIGAEGRGDYLVEQFEPHMSLRSAILITLEALTLDACEKYLQPRDFEVAILDRNGFRLFDKPSVKYVVNQVVY